MINNNQKKLYEKEIEIAKLDYNDLIDPFRNDTNKEIIEKQKNKKIKKILKMYIERDKKLESIKDNEERVIMTYIAHGYSLRKIAKTMHYSHTAIWKKIKKYKGQIK